jgi:hypothetical protein
MVRSKWSFFEQAGDTVRLMKKKGWCCGLKAGGFVTVIPLVELREVTFHAFF